MRRSLLLLYHLPKPIYQTADLLAEMEDTVLRIQQDFLASHVVLGGDLNAMSDSEIVIRTGMKSLVTQPTKGNSNLDRVYVTDPEYDGINVITPAVKTDHRPVVVYYGLDRIAVNKTSRRCTFRKHTSDQHARFLSNVSAPVHTVNTDTRGDPQVEFDRFYSILNDC